MFEYDAKCLSTMLNVVGLNIKHCASGHDIIQSDFFACVLTCFISILLVYVALSMMLNV